jgi:hypothetical protein
MTFWDFLYVRPYNLVYSNLSGLNIFLKTVVWFYFVYAVG